MGRKKRNENMNERESDGGSTGRNIQNNTIPDAATTATATATATATTTMRFSATQLGFTKNQMKKINKELDLKGYPKSMEFAAGYKHYLKHEDDQAIASFIHGAVTYGCVGCMYVYADLQKQRGNMHLALPFYLEAALRGNTRSMGHMMFVCYSDAMPQPALAFQNFWIKIRIELGDTMYTKEEKLARKKKYQSMCFNCDKELDYGDMTSKKWCGGCRYYSYCGPECQRQQWEHCEGGGNHIGECRQLKILKHNYRHYGKDIREAIIRGEDPRTIDRLQKLRSLLGLNRPTEEYEDLLSRLSDDDKNDTSQSPNRFEYLTARKDGTVWIGSTPNVM